MKVTILGIRKSKSKDRTKDYFNYYFSRPFTDFEAGNGSPDTEAYGLCVGSEFTTQALDCKVGDVVELYYQPGYQGKAVVSGCQVVKPASVK